MGLDFSHTDVRWSYTGFSIFRKKLAKQIGMDLDKMVGFGGDIPFANFKDDIIPLLDHSDCEGELTVQECKKVAPRLKELISNWEDDDFDKIRAIELAEGMEKAIACEEPLEFW